MVMNDEIITPRTKRFKKALMLLLVTSVLFVMATVITINVLNAAPEFPEDPIVISIEPGTSIRTITENFASAGIVKSSTLLYFTIVLFFEPTEIKASTYYFDSPLSTYEVARQLVSGDFDTDLVRFTHFEGERATSIATRASESLVNFDTERFLTLAVPMEGKLFPETYYIPPYFTAEELFTLMTRTFNDAIVPLEETIAIHPLTLDEILILASIIEREANSPESMMMVSGILQNRLAIDMPLQADASIEYVLDKPLNELLPEDLRIDSPYNTYLNRGLPPTPIGNPGLTAINAVLQPTLSKYLFYITDETGTFHYAEDFDQHRVNIERYLR
jgi:UPF0755 protein